MMRALQLPALLAGALLLAAVGWDTAGAQQPPASSLKPGPKSIAGVVTGPSGPEAGVWVVAETTE